MSFLRPNEPDQSGQAIPNPPPPDNFSPPPPPSDEFSTAPAPPAKDSGSRGGIIGWLGDTYNGLYRIVVAPSMPTRATVVLLVVGILFGMLLGYVINPVQYYNGNVDRLNDGSQNAWLLLTAVGLQDSGAQFTPEQAANFASRVPNPSQRIQSLLDAGQLSPSDAAALQNLQSALPPDIDAQSPEPFVPPNPITDGLVTVLVPIIAVVIIFPILVVLWRLLIRPNFYDPVVDRMRQATDADFREQRQREQAALAVAKQQREAKEAMQREVVASDYGPPIMTQLSIYSEGRAYDDSFEIELDSGEFLGQCGAVIAEATDPDPVAVEIWVFDMFSQQNLKKVFVTQQGANDPAIRGRIEADVNNPATDIVVAVPGATAEIETDKLVLQGKIAEVTTNPNGRYASINLQMRAWQKDGAIAAAPPPIPQAPAGAPDMSAYDNMQFDLPPQPPSGGRPMDDYANIQFDPPPQPPSGGRPMDDYANIQFDPPPQPPGGGQQPPSLGSMLGSPPPQPGGQPLQPPPLNFPPGFEQPSSDDDEDDPFGGTGDFTPLGGR